jgi:pyruvate kinase
MSEAMRKAIRRTKIVATLGPATADPKTVRALVEAGVDVFRANFSHGDHGEHGRSIAEAQSAAADRNRFVAVLQDLQGPKIRVASLPGGAVELQDGAEVTITTRDASVTDGIIPTTYSRLPRDVRTGHRLLLDDGLLELRAVAVSDDSVKCEVVQGGVLHERKGINLPDSTVSAPAMTEKDAADLRFGLRAGVDMAALSFVRTAADGDVARRVMQKEGRRVPLLAKIEKPEALNELTAILRRFDGAMVARGDLGVEMAPEMVPGVQKKIIAAANALGKPVITATQMLESMTSSPRPTRAEASDVANAVLDGTDAVMLSGETAVGRYPMETVQTMDRIVREAESVAPPRTGERETRRSHAHAVCHGAVTLADEVGAVALAAFTRSGRTVQILSGLRPTAPIFAFCEKETVARRLALWRGVVPLTAGLGRDTDETARVIASELRRLGLADPGADVVVVGASRDGGGRANLIRLVHVNRE